MIQKQLSIFLENKPGLLADLTQTLADEGVNIRGTSVSDTVDHSVIRLVVDDPVKATHALGERGTLVVETEILALNVADTPGELARLARKLAKAKINIEYAYGSSLGEACTLYLRVSDIKKAKQLFSPKKKARKKKAK